LQLKEEKEEEEKMLAYEDRRCCAFQYGSNLFQEVIVASISRSRQR
jgi:hypothetical protein